MKVRRFKSQFLTASAMAAVAIGAASPAVALDELVDFKSHLLIGDPRRGTDEDYFNTAALEYTSPDNIINGTPQVLGSQPGHTESIRLGLGGSTGINVPQPHLLPASDPRSGFGAAFGPSSAIIEGALGAAPGTVPLWGARAGAIVQWQSIQPEGESSASLLPLGRVNGVGHNLTPGNVNSAVVLGLRPDGTPALARAFDDGLSPGSAMESVIPGLGITDALGWVREGDGLITGFDIELVDSEFVSAAIAGGAMKTPAGGVPVLADAIDALVGRIDIREGGGIYDQAVGVHDEDAIDHPAGGIKPGFPGDALNDGVDGTLLLSGTLEDATVKNRWRAEILGVDPGPDGVLGAFPFDPFGDDDIWIADPDTIRRTINFQTDVVFDSGTIFDLPKGLTSNMGTLSANWVNIPFTNVDGMDDFGLMPNEYDFVGDGLSTYDSSFIFEYGTGIPEPVSAATAMLAFGALGMRLTRRR